MNWGWAILMIWVTLFILFLNVAFYPPSVRDRADVDSSAKTAALPNY